MSHPISGKLLALGVAVLLSAPFVSLTPVAASHENQPNTTYPVCTPENQQPCMSEYDGDSCLPEHTTSGYLQKNIHVEYLDDDTALIQYQALECDVDVNFSSYVMPADYDGGEFAGNETAYPQAIFDNETVSITGGKAGTATLNVNLPDVCHNVQVDVYFGDVIETVGPEGHGTYNLLSQVYLSEGDCEVAPGGIGGEAPVVVTPAAPAPTTPATPVAPVALQPQLANTGASAVVAYSAAAAVAASTLLGTRYVRNYKI